MKKFLRTFMLLFMLVPFALLATACGDKEDPYDKEANVEAYNEAVNVLETSLTGNNYTQRTTIALSQTLQELIESSSGDAFSMPNTTLKYDNGNIYMLTENMAEVYLIGDQYIEREYDEENSEWGEYSTTNSFMIGMATGTLQSMDFDMLRDFAFKFDEKAINTSVSNGTQTVSVRINLGTLLQKVMNNLKVNKNRPMINVINQLIADLYSPEVTVEKIVTAMKTRVTADTTLGDILEMVETSTGYDLGTMLESTIETIKQSMAAAMYSETITSSGLHTGINFGSLSTEDESLAMLDMVGMMMDVPLFEILEVDATTFETKLDALLASLQDEDNTIINMLVGMMLQNDTTESLTPEMALENVESIFTLFDALVFRDLSVVLKINTNEEVLQGWSMDLNADIGFVGVAGGMALSATINNVYSDIGTTEVALPSSIQVSNASYVIEVNASLLEDLLTEDLVISDVDFAYLEDFTLQTNLTDMVVYNSETKTLTIANEVVGAFLNAVVAEEAENLLRISVTFGSIDVTLSVVFVPSQA